MATMNIELDISDWYSDNSSLEEYVRHELLAHIKSFVQNAANETIKKQLEDAIISQVAAQIDKGVEAIIHNLLSEERAYPISHAWDGAKTFIGTFEDFIAFKMNDKINYPTDNRGKRIVACSSETGHTWLTYHIGQQIESTLNTAIDLARKETKHFVIKEVEERCANEHKKIISQTILDRMEQLGIIGKGAKE